MPRRFWASMENESLGNFLAQHEPPTSPDAPSGPAAAGRQRLAAAVVAVSVITIVGKIAGFAEKVAVAHFFGTTGSADVYFAVMAILWSAVFLARELALPSLLPVFRAGMLKGSALAGGIFRGAFLAALGLSLFVVVAVALLGGRFVALALPGFKAAQSAGAVHLLRLAAPALICLLPMVVTYTCLNARKKFAASAFGESLFKILLVAGVVLTVPRFALAGVGPVIAVSALVALSFHLWFVPDRRYVLRPFECAPAEQEYRSIWHLVQPLIVGVTLSHVAALVANTLASTLPSGSLSYLNYGRKLVDGILTVGPVAVVTVVYSHMAHLNAEGKRDDMSRMAARTARLLVYLGVPLACVVIQLRFPLVRMLFQHGRFDEASTAGTAGALLVYAPGIVVFALEGLLVYSFYAMSDTRTPVLLGIAFVAVDIALALVLMRPWGYIGIAAAHVSAKAAKTACLALLLRKKLPSLWTTGAPSFILKLSAAAAGLWLAAGLSGRMLAPRERAAAGVPDFIVPAAVGVSAFAVISYLLGLEEPGQLAAMVKEGTKRGFRRVNRAPR